MRKVEYGQWNLDLTNLYVTKSSRYNKMIFLTPVIVKYNMEKSLM